MSPSMKRCRHAEIRIQESLIARSDGLLWHSYPQRGEVLAPRTSPPSKSFIRNTVCHHQGPSRGYCGGCLTQLFAQTTERVALPGGVRGGVLLPLPRPNSRMRGGGVSPIG